MTTDTTSSDRKLADALVTITIATCARDHVNGPHGIAGPVWRLVGNGGHRSTLADLPASHGDAGPLNPGPPNLDQDPIEGAAVRKTDWWPA